MADVLSALNSEEQGLVETMNAVVQAAIDVAPDFNAPGMALIRTVAGWVLGIGTMLALISLIFCVIMIVFKGFGNQGAHQFGAKNVLWAVIGVAVLGSITVIFNYILGLDLGIGN